MEIDGTGRERGEERLDKLFRVGRMMSPTLRVGINFNSPRIIMASIHGLKVDDPSQFCGLALDIDRLQALAIAFVDHDMEFA